MKPEKDKGNIQPLFPPLQAGLWSTSSPSLTAVVQNRTKHTACCCRTSTLTLVVCVLGFFVLRSLCYGIFVMILHYRHQDHWVLNLPCLRCSWCLAELENATSGCSFPGSSGGILQLSHIHTAKTTEFKNSCEIQLCLICLSVWPASVGSNLFDSK